MFSKNIWICALQNSQSTKYTAASVFKIYEEYLWRSSFLVKLNSFASIFWLVLAQLQNRLFVEHLPMAAYVRCLKEKEWKKWNSCFYCTQSDILLCAISRFSWGNKNKLKTFQPQKLKKKRTVSIKQNLLVLIKKECTCTLKQLKWKLGRSLNILD